MTILFLYFLRISFPFAYFSFQTFASSPFPGPLLSLSLFRLLLPSDFWLATRAHAHYLSPLPTTLRLPISIKVLSYSRILHKYSATHSMCSASHSNVPNSTMDCTKIMSWTSDAAYQHLICVTSRHVCLSQGHSTTYALRIERLLCRSQDWCCRLKFQIWS